MSLLDGKVFTGGPALLGARDTGPARLPGLGAVSPTGNASLDTWLRQATEVIEVRNGARGNPWERTVTVREFAAMAKEVDKVMPGARAMTDLLSGKGMNSGEATRMIDAFTKAIKDLQVYKDLIKRLDDPSRFDNLPAEIREELLRSIAEEAAKRGAAISRVETVLQDANRSLAYEVKMVTAAVERAQAGIREVQFATAETNFAQAGKITQLEASLGNYYQDGTPGRALLEEQMTVTADKIAGLSSQWTMKVQAGKYVAGIGLAATENPDGSGTSALIIAAEKFAIVNPATYTTGLTNTPDPAHIPFGVDANGIYLNHNVYVRGQMRVDTTGKTLLDGLRGSVNVDAGTGAWSDTVARNAVWAKLGKTGTAPNSNHLVIGDQVRIGTTVRMWGGSAWTNPGVVINGSMVVDGSIAAQKINTNGLDIRDAWGNVIFSAGVDLNMSRVAGLGALASRNTAEITDSAATSTVTVNGVRLRTTDFVHALSKINSSNISTFMESAAIGNAYIGNAAVGTLQIAGGSVTSMRLGVRGSTSVAAGAPYGGAQATVYLPAGASGAVATAAIQVTAPGSDTHVLTLAIYRSAPDGSGIELMGSTGVSVVGGKTYTHTLAIADSYPRVGGNTYTVWLSADWGRSITVDRSTIAVSGGSR